MVRRRREYAFVYMELLTDLEVSRLAKLSRRQIHKLRAARLIPPPVRIGRSTRWRAADIERWIDAGCDMKRMAAEGGARS